jgi:hypothetical protein
MSALFSPQWPFEGIDQTAMDMDDSLICSAMQPFPHAPAGAVATRDRPVGAANKNIMFRMYKLLPVR